MSYDKISSCISITYAAVLQTPFCAFAVLLTLLCLVCIFIAIKAIDFFSWNTQSFECYHIYIIIPVYCKIYWL